MTKIFHSIFFTTILILTIFFNNSIAQESNKSSKLIVKKPSITMTRSPRGGKMGEVYINSPVEVVKEDGDWALVSIKAWVKKDGLAGKIKKSTKTTGVVVPSKDLTVETYSTRIVEEGLPEKRVYLKLKLKNNTKQLVKEWSALLVATVNDKVAFRETISDDSKQIAAGKEIEVNFYWEPGEKPFSYLETATPEGTVLKLYKVKLNQLN